MIKKESDDCCQSYYAIAYFCILHLFVHSKELKKISFFPDVKARHSKMEKVSSNVISKEGNKDKRWDFLTSKATGGKQVFI